MKCTSPFCQNSYNKSFDKMQAKISPNFPSIPFSYHEWEVTLTVVDFWQVNSLEKFPSKHCMAIILKL